jgi:alkylation response protein AidB-like acyl-CoA dehydrogenase
VVLYPLPVSLLVDRVLILIRSGVWPSGTALISFDNVAVPVENMIGDENMGFKYAMVNFNNERMGICAQVCRSF